MAILIMTCTLILIHNSISLDSTWRQSINVAAVVFIYGFPYILAIPAIWDIALQSSIKNYFEKGWMDVRNEDVVEKVGALDYLAVQAISVLDEIIKPEKLEGYKRAIKGLQAAGVKVVLVTGLKESEARKIAVATGILDRQHEKICGAVISGSQLSSLVSD